MTGWLVLLVLAGGAGALLFRVVRPARSVGELIAAALLLGIAGYAWQGSPGLSGAPKPPRAAAMQPDSVFAEERSMLMERFGPAAPWLNYADALHRMGNDRLSVTAMKSGLRERPNDPDLWVGLGNALVLHGGGVVSPAARFAFERAETLAPNNPAAPYFLGLAYAQAGQMEEAAAMWRGLLERSPPNASWRPEIARRLAELEQQVGAR